MKLVSYRVGGTSHAGVVVGESRIAALPRGLREILSAGEEGLESVRAVAGAVKSDHALDDVELLPVIPDPPAIWCVGVNYDDT